MTPRCGDALLLSRAVMPSARPLQTKPHVLTGMQLEVDWMKESSVDYSWRIARIGGLNMHGIPGKDGN